MASSSSIPSLLYHDYGADRWIDTGVNGFVVRTKEEVLLRLQELIENPILLEKNSNGAFLLSKDFDWRIRIKDWEKAIDNLK